jgi:hypothetical protein
MNASQPAGNRAVVPILLNVFLATAGCSSPVTPISQQNERRPTPMTTLQPMATLQEIMAGEIDPSADALWGAVEYVSTLEGTHDHLPHTEEEWQALHRSAALLAEATNLLAVPRRRIGGATTVSGAGELNMAEIQRLVDSRRESFDQFAAVLRLASLSALSAIDEKDPKALMDAGAAIDAACEGCHRVYWYPDQGE